MAARAAEEGGQRIRERCLVQMEVMRVRVK
jgi:hypothetical protein